MSQRSNFTLQKLSIMVNADTPEGPQKRQVDLSANHLLELHYIEDITKANTVTAITINDTAVSYTHLTLPTKRKV